MNGHLIHIGYPKAGSTFLQEWFRQHPQLFYSPGGLGGFNNVYEISRHATQKEDLDLRYFVTSDESLSIPKPSTGFTPIEYGRKDFTWNQPAESTQKKVCEVLRCLYPNAKILFVTRGFKGIIMSGYSQYTRAGGIQNFQQYVEIIRSYMQTQTDKSNYGEEIDYTYIANIYEEAFGKENLIVLPFELLRDDKNKFLSVIEERLGLSHFEANIGRMNESLSPEELYWYPRISSVVSRVSNRFGQKGYSKIYSWYVSKTLENKLSKVVKVLNRIKPNRRATDDDFPFEILDYFRENNTERFAAKFRDDPMYSPYLSEYLLD